MKVVRAEHAGACYGVQRALDMAAEAAEQGNTAYTLGPLIHNPVVVNDLQERGVAVAHCVADVPHTSDTTLIIRSHGVTPEVRDEVDASGVHVMDATCPHVTRAQKAAAQLAREGYQVLVVGEPGHPEVEGLRAYALRESNDVLVVAGPEDVPAQLHHAVGIVVQTTQRSENMDAVIQRVREQGIEPQVKRTICSATSKRQDAAAALASQVDAIVVIGGRNSSNTTRLAEICAAVCPRTYHIQSAEELQPGWFEGCATVGVTAGASTPETQISQVVQHLEAL